MAEPLGHSGVGVAGDAFDFRIIDNVVAPRLGKGGSYRAGAKLLPIPGHQYGQFAQWHQLAMLKSPRVLADLRKLAKDAEDPDAIEDFITVIEMDLGFGLYRAVSEAKTALSAAEQTELVFDMEGVKIREKRRASRFRALDCAGTGADRCSTRPGLCGVRPDAGRCRPGLHDRRLVLRAGVALTVRIALRRGTAGRPATSCSRLPQGSR
jgi:hypothetical protein